MVEEGASLSAHKNAAPKVAAQKIESADRFAMQQEIVRGRMPVLDGLRGIAILTVIWHNVTAGQYVGGPLLKLINLLSNTGWLGVQLFFVLSGFLITGILLDEKGAPRQLQNFYMRRVLRIFPIYYAFLFGAFVLLPALHIIPEWLQEARAQQFWYWTFLINWASPFFQDGPAFGHLWSLAVEEQFYLLWPACVLLFERRSLIVVSAILVMSAIAVRLGLTSYDVKFAAGAAYKFTVARWDALAVGAILALIVRRRDWYEQAIRFIPAVFFVSIAYILAFIVLNKNFAAVGELNTVFNQTAAALLFGALLFGAIRPVVGSPSYWQRFLANAPLRSIGKYSYAIYIFHLPMIQITLPLKPHYFAERLAWVDITIFAMLVFAASYIAAVCSWYLLEQPCQRLKRFFVSAKPAMA